MKFPPSFALPVDLTRVNWEAVRPWIAERVTALLGGVEDDVLIGFISEQLEGKEVRTHGWFGRRWWSRLLPGGERSCPHHDHHHHPTHK